MNLFSIQKKIKNKKINKRRAIISFKPKCENKTIKKKKNRKLYK